MFGFFTTILKMEAFSIAIAVFFGIQLLVKCIFVFVLTWRNYRIGSRSMEITCQKRKKCIMNTWMICLIQRTWITTMNTLKRNKKKCKMKVSRKLLRNLELLLGPFQIHQIKLKSHLWNLFYRRTQMVDLKTFHQVKGSFKKKTWYWRSITILWNSLCLITSTFIMKISIPMYSRWLSSYVKKMVRSWIERTCKSL